ncbi:hypothetical protein IWQ55_006637 [Labrenzia sp. EL_208]|nr:hypothetical protein [Labrenzia sp. EL_132]MBG6233395.1 hypothetical protein [Labrenzia sp. EL_208]
MSGKPGSTSTGLFDDLVSAENQNVRGDPSNPFTQELNRRQNDPSHDLLAGLPPRGMVYNPKTGQMVDAAAIAQRQNEGFWGQIATAGATAMEGVPVIGAYVRDVAGMGDPVQREVASQRMDQFAEERPASATGLNVAGAVAGIAPAVAAAPAAFGSGGGGMLANSLASSASGAAIGAADSAARSDGDLTQVGYGAALGGGLGLAGPAVTAGVGKAAHGVGSLFKGQSGRAQVGADKLLSKALERDGLSAGEAATRLREMGSDAVAADIAPNLRQQAEGLASMQGPAQNIVRNTLDARASGSGQRVANSLDDALGQPVNTLQSADDIIAQRSAAAGPLYESASTKPIPFSKELESLLSRPAMHQALKRAQTLAANEGIPSQQWFINIADDAAATIRNVPDVRQLDYTKRALDDMIGKAGSWTNEGRILTGLKNKLTKIVDDAVPEYGQARKAIAGPSGVLEAMEGGKSVFKNSKTPEQIRRALSTMGESEREAYLQGARAAVADIMGTARNDANAAMALFDRGYNREKLSILIGDQQARSLLSRLQAERTFAQTRNQVTGNSRTAPRQDVMRELGNNPGGNGFMRSAMNLNFGDAAANIGTRVTQAFKAPGIERRNEALAQALMDKVEFNNASQRMLDATLNSRNQVRDAMVRALMSTGGVNR